MYVSYQQTLKVVVESCLKIKTIRSVFKAEPKKNTFPLFCYFYDEISAKMIQSSHCPSCHVTCDHLLESVTLWMARPG